MTRIGRRISSAVRLGRGNSGWTFRSGYPRELLLPFATWSLGASRRLIMA
jgi:hypothetical protein